MIEGEPLAEYPEKLVNWAGHRSGGVRRLFDDASGRPGNVVFQTNLLHRLEAWTASFAKSEVGTPRVLLLVGGPGNGKTEAIEADHRVARRIAGADLGLLNALRIAFAPPDGIVPTSLPISNLASCLAFKGAAT